MEKLPAAIDPVIKKQVIVQYLQGVSRDRIAADNGVGTGTVSNIIDEWKKGVQGSDFEPVRELAIQCKKEVLICEISCLLYGLKIISNR
jgi:hypothetical protein